LQQTHCLTAELLAACLADV